MIKLSRITADTVENTLGIKERGEGSAGSLLPIILDRKAQWLVDNTGSVGSLVVFPEEYTPTGFCDGSSDQRTKQTEAKIAPKDLVLRNYKEKPFIGIRKTAGGGLILSVTASCPYQSAPKVLPAHNKNEPMTEMS